MTQKGPHTWDLIMHYHRCPVCGRIFDSRVDYEDRLGKYQKDLECPACGHSFTVTKIRKLQAGPFFGDGDRAEVTWR